MQRYMLKVNGVEHCPDGISRPKKSSDWEGGKIELPVKGPELGRLGRRIPAPDIAAGDELWIWSHQGAAFGNGRGLTARATAGETSFGNGKSSVKLQDVSILPRKFGKVEHKLSRVNSRLIDYLIRRRHYNVYHLEDGDHEEILSVLAELDRPVLEHIAREETELWHAALRSRAENPIMDRARRMAYVRPAQSAFRRAVLDRYGSRCILTGCGVRPTVEAAHVVSHNSDPVWDHPENRVPLRRDLHALFDRFLWSIEPETGRAVFATSLLNSLPEDDIYHSLNGITVSHLVPKILIIHPKSANP